MPHGPATITPRARLAIAAGKAAGVASRQLGRGGGTSLPGLIASRIDPTLLGRLARQLDQGSIVVAGTNGKTTTARLLADMLRGAGLTVVHNRSGANLVSGIATALLAATSPSGHTRGQIGLFECDEFALPAAAAALQPRLAILTNLFRDQLDRYGELETINATWRRALAALPADAMLVVNGDDPALASMAAEASRAVRAYGVDDPAHRLPALPHAADSTACRRCGATLHYTALYLAHLGAYTCPACGAARPRLDLAARAIRLDGLAAVEATLHADMGDLAVRLPVPGFYNVYNVLAAALAARSLGVDDATIGRTVGAFQAPFGRVERVRYRERDLVLMLAKNPVGFNEVLRLVQAAAPDATALIVINDRIADGRDVSWLWDVDFEVLAGGSARLVTSGSRAADMALRLKYAGCDVARLQTVDEIGRALDALVEASAPGATLPVIVTYTALLETRRLLVARGAAEAFWRQ